MYRRISFFSYSVATHEIVYAFSRQEKPSFFTDKHPSALQRWQFGREYLTRLVYEGLLQIDQLRITIHYWNGEYFWRDIVKRCVWLNDCSELRCFIYFFHFDSLGNLSSLLYLSENYGLNIFPCLKHFLRNLFMSPVSFLKSIERYSCPSILL